MAIHIVRVRTAIGQDRRLGSVNMFPGGFFFNEFGKEKTAAEVIDGCDQGPFDPGGRGPKVDGAVVLNEFADIIRYNFAVMGFLFVFLGR